MGYTFFNKYILRTPLKSIVFFKKDALINEFANKVSEESIFIASPSLLDDLKKWNSGKLIDKKEKEKLFFSLAKYLSRMSTRCTPFGLFAGSRVGYIGNKTTIFLSDIHKHQRHTRLDMNFLCALSEKLAIHPELKKVLTFFPNSSLYCIGDKYRYVEYHYENSKRIHQIISVEKTTYLENLLLKCRNGAYYNELVNSIVDDDISLNDASIFVDELIGSQVIVSEIEPSTTGLEQLEYIIYLLRDKGILNHLRNNLSKINEILNDIDKQGIGNSVERYDEILNIIKKLEVPYDIKYLFQTDLVISCENNTISHKIPNMIKDGIDLLRKINYRLESSLDKFKEAFYDRYEELEIPLAQALDPEIGLGYPVNDLFAGDINPLVDNIRVPARKGIRINDIKWNVIQSYLLKKYREAIKNNLWEVIISDEEINLLTKDFPLPEALSDSFASMVQVVEADTDNDNYKILIKTVGGATGASLLGRFCHGDNEMFELVKEITKYEHESAGDAIVAEIVHLPESRTGNVLLRPVIRDYEIPYLARASVEKEFQLTLDDLFLSVRNNRLYLRSKKMNKEILPRLTNAHNFSFNALPIYHFLCDMQYQNILGGVGFSWGPLEGEYPFLPRVVYKNIILSPATWNIIISDIKNVFEGQEDDSKLLENVKRWREDNRIPNRVLLSDGDNELFIDLEYPIFIRTLWDLIKKRQVIQLKEFLFNPEKPLVKGENGWYTNELILLFRKEK